VTVQFEDRLLDVLLDEYETLTAPTTPPIAARSAHRVRAMPAVFGTVGIAAAAVVAVVLASGPAPAPRRAPGKHTRPAPTPGAHPAPVAARQVDVRYVVHAMNAALSTNTDVLRELVHAPDSQTSAPTVEETWARGGTDTSHSITLNPQGQPVSGVLMTITPTQTISTTIDYASQTYTQHTYPFGSSGSGPAPAPATPTGQAGALRAQVKAGEVTLVGPATVDGQQTIELRDTRFSHGTIELWVDPTTYLPVQEVDIPTGQTADSGQAIRTQYQWLPATQANLAELTPAGAIPSGFQPATGD
jgi:hypothetical protein